MEQAAKLVTDAIIGNDFKTIIVNKIPYTIYPPTINKMSGAISCLSVLDIPESGTFKEILMLCKDMDAFSKALSWVIKGDDSLSVELSQGTHEEVVEGLNMAFSLIPAKVFRIAANLMKSASLLAARPKS
jgi:hypothetical protein